MISKSREVWVDYVKAYACILVATGHFFQSMISAEIIPQRDLFGWFNTTIYYFHVPLFFVCSGYLHQKKSCIDSFLSWGQNVLKKALVLGIPYFTFSIATWLLKTIFSSVVNTQANRLFHALFFDPMSPYWYLYALFFIVIIFLPFANRKMALVGVAAVLILKLIKICIGDIQIYAVAKVMDNAVWFVFGMLLCFVEVPNRVAEKNWLWIGIICGAGFLVGSVVIYFSELNMKLIPFFFGLLGCAAPLLIIIPYTVEGKRIKLLDVISKYLMPIFLMHTIFAACVRSILLKMNISNFIVHVVFGLLFSFIGPMAAAEIMKLTKLDILIYPRKYIKLFRKNEVE